MADQRGGVLEDLDARGLVQDHTDRPMLAARLAEGPVTLYCGFDPTADSLHLGHLQQMLALRRFQLAGHKPLALAGGATGMVGDPAWRGEGRDLLDDDTLDRNVTAIKAQLSHFLDFDAGSAGAELVDNREWTGELRLLDFLRDVGRHVTVNQMTAKESVRARLDSEQGLSYTEFSYMLLQANDYWWLNQHRSCELQIGGSDQWGNITAGVELIRRRSGRGVHALTMPLVTDQHGVKFGKSTGGGIWLDPAKTSPYRFFQFLIQVDDSVVRDLLLRLTLLAVSEVDDVAREHARVPEDRGAQRRLAQEVTCLVHGQAAARGAEEASSILFGGVVSQASPTGLAMVASELAPVAMAREKIHAGIGVVDLLTACGLAASKGEARRTVAQGGAYLNGVRAADDTIAHESDLLGGRFLLVRRGKQAYALVEIRAGDGPSRS